LAGFIRNILVVNTKGLALLDARGSGFCAPLKPTYCQPQA
jgi:hypothetical protein